MLVKHNFQIHNKKVLGKFKDEVCGRPIKHFVGLRSKCYAFEVEGKNENKINARCKGVSSSVVRKYNLNPYIQTLRSGNPHISKMQRIKSKLHVLTTVVENKTAMTRHDDKRFQIPNSVKTLPWYHKNIRNFEE